MLDEEKLPFLTWHPSGLTPWQIWWSLCVQNRQLNALFVFLVLFGAHILSFY